jgi:hypothetical protein
MRRRREEALDAKPQLRVGWRAMHEPKPRTLPLFALASAAAFPFVVALGACGGGTPATTPGNASASASVTALASTSAAPTDTSSTATTSTGPASALPTASQPSSITSKKTMRKKSPEWLVCHKDYQPQTHGRDLAADVKREGTMCQDTSGMHAMDAHLFKGKKDSDPPDTFTFPAHAGKCYRAFAESAPGIDDLDLVIKDSDRNVAGEDSTDDPNPIVLEEGAVCFNTDDTATVSSTIGSGHGDYIVQVWTDE